MDDVPPRPTTRFPWLPVTLILIIAASIVGVFVAIRNQPPNPAPLSGQGPKLSREQSIELLEMRDRAIGYLEIHKFDEAEALLMDIMQKLSDDPFGPRNLVICRQLAAEKLDASQAPEKLALAMDKSKDASDQLGLAEPNSHVPHVLAARVALKRNDLDRATEELLRATELAPKSAPAWYDLFLLKPVVPGEPPPKQTVDALRKVNELEPDNLFVVKDWLLLQVQLKDPGLPETIRRARETLEPFADVIKTHLRGADVRQMMDRLEKAVADQQWPVATSTAMTIRNVIVAESSRDERYVHVNSLEYLLLDYGPAFYDRADLPDAVDAAIPVKFTSKEATVSIPAGGRQLAVADMDFDGRLDAVVPTDNSVGVVMPLDASAAGATNSTIEIGDGFDQLLVVDLDDDADPKLLVQKHLNRTSAADLDVIAYGAGGLKLFENRLNQDGNRELVDRNDGSTFTSLKNVRVLVPADLDLDGDLDLLTISDSGVQMWSNKGNWSFDEITSRSKLPENAADLTAAAAVDWDRDTDIDVIAATADGLGIFENLRHGRFRWRMLDGDFASVKRATSLTIEQLGQRPSWSVLAGGPTGIQALWTQTTTAGTVTSKQFVHVSAEPVHSIRSLDFDNDGVRDLVASSDPSIQIWRGLPSGEFQKFDSTSIADTKAPVATAIADFDQDGDEDLLVHTSNGAKWFANDGGNANGWLDVTLVAEQRKPNEQNYSKRVNNLGIGSMLEVRSGVRYQSQVARGLPTHFGLGPHKNAEVLRVLWTNGLPQNVVGVNANQRIYEEQILLGSCPYFYTWDGEKFVFLTDLLWNAPLGLKFAENVIAPWREWEYLKIDGDKLRPKDGHYPLRVTAELWEIEYFDQIKLFAVDHPAGTEVFTNEKVGPPDLAEPRIHTIRKSYTPIAARDPQGQDILDQVKSRDGVYTRTYERKLAQGLTNDHFLELDLGQWPQEALQVSLSENKPPVVTLFLTGWMFPGSTSLRVQHSQNPDLQPPRPPALHAVDATGNWREVRPFMGFPGGKTKTIAVDISDVFTPESKDHRLRIVTNMEFYWDAAFFTINDQAVPFEQHELTLGSAKLVDRGGVSRHSWPETGNGPDQFDYQDLVPGDAWPPIEGAFTRYGDVLPLLTARDDHQVVMHPGDEIQLQFAEPAKPLPEGWVRDFVIYNVGWDKDCDQNTVYGETSEPLPFQAMTVYPLQDGNPRPMDEAYARYLKTYQTRYRPRSPFWNRVSAKP